MNGKHGIDDETLMAYADGQLAAADAARVEAAMAADPALAAAADRHRRLRARLAHAFAPVAEEPVPERLVTLLGPTAYRGAPAATATATAATLPARRGARRRLRWADWSALAACLLFGALLSRALAPYFETTALASIDGQLQAHGALEDALMQRLAADGPSAQGISVGLSFRTHAGDYCRSFSLTRAQPTPLAGLACRTGHGWQVAALAAQVAPPGGDLRQAAATLPPAVLEAVDARIEGEPLSATGERAARSAGWPSK